MQKGEMRHHGVDEQATAQPHGRHARAKEKSQAFPFLAEVLPWQLHAGEDKLNTEDKTCEVEGDFVKSFIGVEGVFVGPDEVDGVRGEYYACD